jgi:hypothetical protein
MSYSKRIFFLALSLFISVIAEAQDRIYKKNGDIIESKVKEINTKTIVFKRIDNLDGPDYSISKTEVSKIVFQNGTEEKIDTESSSNTVISNTSTTPTTSTTVASTTSTVKEEPKPKMVYGKNIISIAPLQMSNSSTLGIGLQYERVLDPNYIISFYSPLLYASITQQYYNSSKGTNDDAQGYMFWVYPGIKVYPVGSDRIVSYGIGPSFALGTGNVPIINRTTSQGTYTESVSTVSKFQIGIIINNSINIQATKNIHIGTELGLGLPYNAKASDKDDDYNETPIVQFNFNIGYRF